MAAFYRRALTPSWEVAETLEDVLTFRSGTAILSVSLVSHRAGLLELSADCAFYPR